MGDWKKTSYGLPDTWAEQQQKRRNEEIAKDGYSPLWDFIKIGVCLVVVVGCVIGLAVALLT